MGSLPPLRRLAGRRHSPSVRNPSQDARPPNGDDPSPSQDAKPPNGDDPNLPNHSGDPIHRRPIPNGPMRRPE